MALLLFGIQGAVNWGALFFHHAGQVQRSWQGRVARMHTLQGSLLLRALARDNRELHAPTNYLNQAGQRQRFNTLHLKKG